MGKNLFQNKILQNIQDSDKEYIIGIDEVGYGALSGPVYVCAFVAPKGWMLEGIDDSKAISSDKTREEICMRLMGEPHKNKGVAYSIAIVHPNSEEYKEYGTNMHGVLKFLYWKAASRVIDIKKQSLIVLDGNIKFPEYPHSLGESISLPKADSLIPQVSAASIIAKVHRDNYMIQLSRKYPEYKWEENKGYGSPFHLAALKKHGYTDEHRRMYEPIKSMIKLNEFTI